MKVLLTLCLLVVVVLCKPGVVHSADDGVRSITGTIFSESDQPVTHAYVTLFTTTPDERAIEGQWTDKHGNYDFPMLSPGLYKLTVSAQKSRPATFEVDLRQPSSGPQDIKLRASRSIQLSDRFIKVPIFFATDRAKAPPPSKDLFANDISSPNGLSYGKLIVDVLKDKSDIHLNLQQWVQEVFDGYVNMSQVDEGSLQAFSENQFLAALGDAHDHLHKGDALVYIHGFASSFKDAACTAAELKYALKDFDGPTILYSWSSHDDHHAYLPDRENNTLTKNSLRDFLLGLAKQPGITRINIVAHSMGNQALVEALEDLAMEPAEKRPNLGEVILAAPDVDVNVFMQNAPAIAKLAKRVTLYTSRKDWALDASYRIWGRYRAGNSDPPPVISPVQTIDATQASTGLIGHGYFISNAEITHDIDRVMVGDALPRAHIHAADSAQPFWIYAP